MTCTIIFIGKIKGPATILVFLGILLDTVKLEMRLPEDRLAALKALLQQWRTTKKTRNREPLSLIGSLIFAAKVISAGRIFLRRLIDLSTSAPPSQQAKCQCKSRHPVVVGFPTKLEWGRSHAPTHRGRHSSPRLCTKPWCLDNGNLVTGALHTVKRPIRHCSRSSHLGVEVANKEDQSLL